MGNNKPKSKSKSSNKNTASRSGGTSSNNSSIRTRSQSTVFTGGCSELKGKIYDCTTYKQADRFILTTKAIAEYVGRSFQNGGDIRASILNEKLFTIPLPDDPADKYNDVLDAKGDVIETSRSQVTYVEDKIFNLALSSYMKRVAMLESNIQKAYALVLGQCTDLITTKLRVLADGKVSNYLKMFYNC